MIKLFLNGQKFPMGQFRDSKWRCYIHDIIEFLSNPDLLKVMMEIDAESFFQVISIIFYPSKTFDLVKQGREEEI